MDAAQYQSRLAQYQSQNAALKNRLYAEYQREPARPPYAALLIVGALIGAVATLLALHLVGDATDASMVASISKAFTGA